jgi:hypothetical protein
MTMCTPIIFHMLRGLFYIILVFAGAFLLLHYYLKNSKAALSAVPPVFHPGDDQKVILPLRLQAYERFVLFLERIHPSNLLLRLSNPELTSVQLQSLLVRTIREEFEYNLSQQLYISAQSWEMIKNAKEEMVALINKASMKAGEQSRAGDLVKAILELMVEKGKLPSELALGEIKKELQKLF